MRFEGRKANFMAKTDDERIYLMEQARKKADLQISASHTGSAYLHYNTVFRKDAKHEVAKNPRGNVSWHFPIEQIPKIVVIPTSSTDIIDAAVLLEEWDIPIGEDIIFISMDEVEEYGRDTTYQSWNPHPPLEDVVAFYETLIEYGDIVLDYRNETFPFEYVPGKTKWDSYWKYDGLRPYKTHVMNIRDQFISTISDYWTGSFISGYKAPRSTSGADLSLERATNLITALSLGMISFDVDAMKRIKTPSWHRSAVQNIVFSDNTMPENLDNLDENVRKAEALLKFWEAAADYDRFSIRLDKEDLDDMENLSALCRRCGEMIGVKSYLDTFSEGVPADDILA